MKRQGMVTITVIITTADGEADSQENPKKTVWLVSVI